MKDILDEEVENHYKEQRRKTKGNRIVVWVILGVVLIAAAIRAARVITHV